MKIPKIGQTLKTPRAVIDKVAYMSRASLKKVFEGYRIPCIMFSRATASFYYVFERPPSPYVFYMGYALLQLEITKENYSAFPSPTPSV